ncbi:hypothetical protein VINI7043_16016 [Vibrio nigripulchritudo ATCC 27043]|uniref:hypothetical protein n=1 Tax=Vibrio nigripulchritudo TaxID=28173 RepID=UPI00021C3B1D|nr:hypothetical protein [Vibrio nigripulchritudo]EGU60157.1 hypothetical protein VINI7043_16016 [Vibrio nigripulchritudo ATCC 27043]
MSKYLKIYFGILLLAFFFIFPIVIYLERVGELEDLDVVVEMQKSSSGNIIYGTALSNVSVSYKTHLLERSNTDIIALGSSRVMQFQEQMFNSSFVNLGGIMNSVNEGDYAIEKIIKKNPKLVILGLDVWWFNENFQPVIEKQVQITEQINISAFKIFSIIKMLSNKKIHFNDFTSVLFYGTKSNNIGLNGISDTGFNRDGSYSYQKLVSGGLTPKDILFQDTIDRMNNGNRRFEYGEKASDYYIQKIIGIVNALKRKNIDVFVFFPPFANEVNLKFNELDNQYHYIDDLKNKLIQYNFEFVDYSSSLPSSDCEFIDGFHGGDVTYARLLLESESYIGNYINKARLKELVDIYTGYAATYSQGKELDFNKLGCYK